MELTGWVVLVPLSLASLATGLVCSLGSVWGLFRHYWVLFKLAINLVATIVLLLYMQTLEHLGTSRQRRPCPVLGLAGCGTHPRCCGRRPAAPAGGHDAGHLQAPRHDPLWAAHPTPATHTPPTVRPGDSRRLPQQRVESPVEV